MAAPKSGRNENFNSSADQLATEVPKHHFDLVIYASNPTAFVNDDDGIGRESKERREHVGAPPGLFTGPRTLSVDCSGFFPPRTNNFLRPFRLNQGPPPTRLFS